MGKVNFPLFLAKYGATDMTRGRGWGKINWAKNIYFNVRTKYQFVATKYSFVVVSK